MREVLRKNRGTSDTSINCHREKRSYAAILCLINARIVALRCQLEKLELV